MTHPTAGTRTGGALRPDVRTARSRMRTKFGSQRQIAELSGLLADDETLRVLAVADGPSRPHRHNHGLLAVSDRRLLFVPTSATEPRLTTELASVHALVWTKGLRSGVLSVVGADLSASFGEMSSADCREIMAVVVQSHPRIKRIGQF